MQPQEVKEIILKELPLIIQKDAEIGRMVRDLCKGAFADKVETESRFDRILDELKKDREISEKKWEENIRQWRENDKKWEKNQKLMNRTIERLEKLDGKIESSLGAIGARWGLHSESAFRNGLRAILETSFGVEVIRVNERDDAGTVFGRPDQIELDIIIQNGVLIIYEIKSSMSKADVHIFERKVRYYESAHNCTCDRMLIISPMVDDRAKKLAARLNIEVYTHAADVTP